jgi:AhpD family alkylhydroperoxidase
MTRNEILKQAKENFGLVPQWLESMPDAALDQYWTMLNWVMQDTRLSARDKALVGFGAASAIHCSYWIPFHTAQLALNGFDDEQIKEAGWMTQTVAGASAYMYSTNYDQARFKQELDQMIQHVRSAAHR